MGTGLLSRCLIDFPFPVELRHTSSLLGGLNGSFRSCLEDTTDLWDQLGLTWDSAEEHKKPLPNMLQMLQICSRECEG